MSNVTRRLGLAALGLMLASACSPERALAPTTMTAPPAAPNALLGIDLGGTIGSVLSALRLVSPVQRTMALSADITVRKTIGVEGGRLEIDAAGVTVIVPAGALSAPTEITMTARAGRMIAYDFAPHGITFNKPLEFRQSLKGTNASILSGPFMKLGYYADERQLGRTTALVSELIGGTLDGLTGTFTARISHFSGYVVTCGRDELD